MIGSCKTILGNDWTHYIRARAALSGGPASSRNLAQTTSEQEKTIGAVDDDFEEEVHYKPEKTLEWLYVLLTALDTKASALMRLNGVVIAAIFVLATSQSLASRLSNWSFFKSSLSSLWEVSLFAAVALPSAISMVLCLCVVNVSWNFLAQVRFEKGRVIVKEEFNALGKTCESRQRMYQIAWRLSMLAAFLFVAIILIISYGLLK